MLQACNENIVKNNSDKKLIVMGLIKEHFKPGTTLSKELELYRILYKFSFCVWKS